MDSDTKWKLLGAAAIFGAVGLCLALVDLNATVFYTRAEAVVTSVDSSQCQLANYHHAKSNVLTRRMPCDEALPLLATASYADYNLVQNVSLTYSYAASSDGRTYVGAGRESLEGDHVHELPKIGQAVAIGVNKARPQESYLDTGPLSSLDDK